MILSYRRNRTNLAKPNRFSGGYLWTASYWTEASVPGGSAGYVLDHESILQLALTF